MKVNNVSSFTGQIRGPIGERKGLLEADRVWLVHRDGFAAAGLLKDKAEEGMVRVQLDYNGDIFDVSYDHL